jgi:hypothetical protein
MVWQEAKRIMHEGLSQYFHSWKNILNSSMNVLYLASFSLKYYTIFQVIKYKNFIKDPIYWQKINSLNQNNSEILTQESITGIYWLNAGNISFFFFTSKIFKI